MILLTSLNLELNYLCRLRLQNRKASWVLQLSCHFHRGSVIFIAGGGGGFWRILCFHVIFQGGKREDQSSPTEVKSGGWTVN